MCSFGVRRAPRLVRWLRPLALSDFFSYIIKWRKDDLVGTLKAHWASYKSMNARSVFDALREAAVPCKDGADAPLRTTYLPLPELVKVCKEVEAEVDEGMPFLKLPVAIDDDAAKGWNFLKTFGVGHEANTRFYLDVLRCFVGTHESPSEPSRKALLRIYEGIEIHMKADEYDSVRSNIVSNSVPTHTNTS